MKNRSLLTLVLFSFLFIGFSTTSCKKDKDESCTNFPVLDGQITINNTSQKLSTAQFLVGQNNYTFVVSGVSDDCNKQNVLDINIEIASGSRLGGTYPIKDFFDADVNEAYGAFATNQVSPISQSSVDLASGTVKITELATKKYTIEVNAVDQLGGVVSISLTHQF
jgi:hypothetical protein